MNWDSVLESNFQPGSSKSLFKTGAFLQNLEGQHTYTPSEICQLLEKDKSSTLLQPHIAHQDHQVQADENVASFHPPH
jgi:hypothetical protein